MLDGKLTVWKAVVRHERRWKQFNSAAHTLDHTQIPYQQMSGADVDWKTEQEHITSFATGRNALIVEKEKVRGIHNIEPKICLPSKDVEHPTIDSRIEKVRTIRRLKLQAYRSNGPSRPPTPNHHQPHFVFASNNNIFLTSYNII